MLVLLVGLALVIPAWLGLFSPGSPNLLSPLPAITTIPAFFFSSFGFYKLAIFIPVALFFLWNPGLLRAEAAIPRRTYVLFAVAIVLSAVWFFGSWSYGRQYQGRRYTDVILIANLIWIVVIAIIALSRWKKMPSLPASIFLHWMLFAWLSWYAFPYLGETP